MTLIASQISNILLVPILLPHARGDDEEEWTKYANKSANAGFDSIYYTIAAVWGYTALRKTNWLPSFLGGPPDGGFD